MALGQNPVPLACTVAERGFLPVTPADWAGWGLVAVTFITVAGGFGTAVWAARKTAHEELRRRVRRDRERLLTVVKIIELAVGRQDYLTETLTTQQEIIAKKDAYEVMPEILGYERTLNSIDISRLPSKIVQVTLVMAANFTKFRIVLQNAFESADAMDEGALQEFREDMEGIRNEMHGLKYNILDVARTASEFKDEF
ncbi:hypothetical protein [Caballeronia glebae]|uniref:hypothetical protein n=1 Tax=Caballeronia glebae TaxID=1777143 RepID=UPI00117EA8BF|nr:hypothetical protein [Caballeronia glebae]